MSYEISYRRQAFRLPASHAQHYEDILFLLEECGSNNCWEIGNRRRSRDWQCTAAGSAWECLAEITRCAAACCGGSLCLYGHRGTTPEAYIRAWRRAITKAVPFEEARRMGFRLQLFVRLTEGEAAADRKFAFDRLGRQALVSPGQYQDPYTGKTAMEWRFDASVPEQVKLWLGTREGGRGWHSVEAGGPGR